MYIIVIALSIVLTTLLYILKIKSNRDKIWRSVYNVKTKKPLPGPTLSKIIYDKFKREEPTMQYFSEYHDTFGDVFFYFYLGLPMISVCDPDLAMDVFKDIETFPKYDLVNKHQVEYFGRDSIGVVNGSRWKETYDIFYPLIKDTKVFISKMDEISVGHVNNLEVGKEYYMFQEMTKATLKILGECIFGAQFSNELWNGRRPLDSFHYSLKNINSDLAMVFPQVSYLPTKQNKELSECIQHIRCYLEHLVKDSVRDFDPEKSEPTCLVELLIKAKSLDKMSPVSIVDNAIMFLSGGHETTTVSLALAIFEIGRNPEIQKQIHQEVDEFIKKGGMDFANKTDLKLLNGAILESVRLYPPIAMLVPRGVTKDTQLGDIFVPKGTFVQVNGWKIHYDERNYPNPTAFCPQRWTKNENVPESNIRRGAFFGFAEGKRTCTGKEFSRVESMIYLVRLLQKYEIVVPEGSKVKFLKNSMLLIPDSNLRVSFKERTEFY